MIRTVLCISETTSKDQQTLFSHISEIAETSKAKNPQQGFTGILARHEKHFLHILEGERIALAELLKKIEADQRNKNLQVMFDVIWTERVFEEWEVLDKASPEYSERFNQFLKVNIDALALLDDEQFEVLSRFVENVFH